MLPTASVMTLPPSARPVPTKSVTERVFSIPCADPAEGHSTAARAATTITERMDDNPDSVSRNTRRLSAQHGSPAREVGVSMSAALATLHGNSLYVSRRDESTVLSISRHPFLRQRIRRRQDDRTDEESDHAETDQAADDPADDQQHWELHAAADQHRAQEIVEQTHRQAPHQEHGGPTGVANPIEPQHRRHEYHQGADLRDSQDEGERGQQARVRNAAHPQADARQDRLHQRRQD